MLKKHKKALLACVMVFAVLLAVSLFLSPKMEKTQEKTHQQQLLASIEQGIGKITLDDRFPILVDIDFYDEENVVVVEMPVTVQTEASTDTMGTTETADATPAETTKPEPFSIYGEITGIGILTIDRIDLKLPVTNGVTEEQLKIAVEHVPDTATIGNTGNAVVAGHRSYTYGEFFNRLGELVVGDTICYDSVDGHKIEFVVYEILEVLPDDQSAFEQYRDKAVLSLYTCTPIRKATHRLVIRAERKI